MVKDLYLKKADEADFGAERYSKWKNVGLWAGLLDGVADTIVIPLMLSRAPRWIPATMMAVPNVLAAAGLGLAQVEKKYERRQDLMKTLSGIPHYVRFEPNMLLFSRY
jgi:hypothetical protein